MTARTRAAGGPTHLDARGRARMVDVGAKPVTARQAVAAGEIRMSRAAFAALRSGRLAKGDAPALARVAAIGAAKRTSEWIPLCHTVPLDHVAVEIRADAARRSFQVTSRVAARWTTGVEMEALVAVAAALLTLYDMGKALDRGMVLGPVRLLRKSGGRSGLYVRGDGRAGRARRRGRRIRERAVRP